MSTSQTTVLRVEGMSCQHCVQHVTSALKKLPGVTDVQVQLTEGRATVTTADAPSLDAMIAAVQDAGYEARSA